MTDRSSRWLIALLAAAILLIAVAGFLLFVPLRDAPDATIYTVGGLTAVAVLSASVAIAILADRHAGEWERSGGRFANQWGMLAGSVFVALLLILPPFQARLLDLARAVMGDGPLDTTVAVFLFATGFCAVVCAQAIAAALFQLAWLRWSSRPGS